VHTTLNANIPALPLDEGITCIPMAVGLSRRAERVREPPVLKVIQPYMFESEYINSL